MTTLDKPLKRIVKVGSQEIVVELIPSEAGFPPLIKLRLMGDNRAYRAITIDPPTETERRA